MKISEIATIASIIMSLGSIITVFTILLKVRNENKKLLAEGKNIDSETDKNYIESNSSLFKQLNEAYNQIEELRKNQEKVICHREYEEHLLRCIRQLNGRLTSLGVEIPCQTLSFDEFMKEKGKNDVKQ